MFSKPKKKVNHRVTKPSPKETTVLNTMKESGGKMRPDDIAEKMGYTESAYVYGFIKGLQRKGFVKRSQGDKFTHYEIIKK